MSRPDVSDERKPQIVQAALKVFNRKGLAAARMEEIAAEAAMSVGGVYWYFKGKDEVVLALMDSLIDDDVAALTAMLHAPGTVQARLVAYITQSATEAMHYLPLTYDLYTQATRNAKIRKHIRAYFTHYRDALTRLIEQGIARGELRAVSAPALATTLAALYEGTLELALLDPASVNVPVVLIESLTFLFEGIKA